MAQIINIVLLLGALNLCSAMVTYTPLTQYNRSLAFQVEAQFPASSGFDVASYSEAIVNLTGLAGCASPILIVMDWGRLDKHLFVTRCALAEIEMHVYSLGRVADLAPIDGSENTALITMIIDVDDPLCVAVGKKISIESIQTLMDPSTAKLVLKYPVSIMYGMPIGNAGVNPSTTSVHPSPTTTSVLSTARTQPSPTAGAPRTSPLPVALYPPIEANTGDIKGPLVVGMWLLVVCVVVASNFLFHRFNHNYYYYPLTPQTAAHSAFVEPPWRWARRTGPAGV
jgi:hypothetical protein